MMMIMARLARQKFNDGDVDRDSDDPNDDDIYDHNHDHDYGMYGEAKVNDHAYLA